MSCDESKAELFINRNLGLSSPSVLVRTTKIPTNVNNAGNTIWMTNDG